MQSEEQDITRLLQAAQNGDASALDALAPRVYAEMRRLAFALLRSENPGHTLQATELVHEAWLKLVQRDSVGVEHRRQFFKVASTIMRRILVDHARAKRARKRGDGIQPEALDATVVALEGNVGDLIDLENALDELALDHARLAKQVELRFFLGLETTEAAKILELSQRQTERDWTLARAWLKRRLDRGEVQPK